MKYSNLLLSCGIMCVALSAAAQLDPRINYSTYLGGSKTSCTDGGAGGTPCSTQPPAKATAKFVAVDMYKFSPAGALVYTYDFDAVNTPSCGDPQDQALHIALNSVGTAAYLTDIGTNGGTLPDCLSATPGALNSPGNTWVAKLNVSAANSASLTYLAFIASPSAVNGIAWIQQERHLSLV